MGRLGLGIVFSTLDTKMKYTCTNARSLFDFLYNVMINTAVSLYSIKLQKCRRQCLGVRPWLCCSHSLPTCGGGGAGHPSPTQYCFKSRLVMVIPVSCLKYSHTRTWYGLSCQFLYTPLNFTCCACMFVQTYYH